MQSVHPAAAEETSLPRTHATGSGSPIRFIAVALWAIFLVSALIPLNAVWISYGGAFFYSGSIGTKGIEWSFEGAPHTLLYIVAPFVNVALGLLLAFFYLPKAELWRPLRSLHLALCVLLGEGLLLATALDWQMPDLHRSFDYSRTFAISAAAVLWFHGLLMESLKRRPIVAVVASSVLLALWHTSFISRVMGIGLDTDHGLHRAIVITFAAVPFGIARYRGASVLSLVLAGFVLSLLVEAYQPDLRADNFHSFQGLLPVCAGYLGLNILLFLLPGSLGPLENVRYRRLLLPGALVLMSGMAPVAKKAKESGPSRGELSPEEKRAESFRLLASEYPRRHIDFGKQMSERVFRERCEQLVTSASEVSDFELLIETRRLIADLQIDHSYVSHPWHVSYRVRFNWLSDGLIVGPVDHPEADPRLKTLRVLRLGSRSPEQVESMIAPFVSHENPNWLRERATELMMWPPLMHKLGITAPDGTLTLHCADSAGTEHELKIAPSSPARLPPSFVGMQRPRLISTVAPELLAKAHGHWGGVLEENPSTLYLRYDGAQGGKENPFGSFAAFIGSMLTFAESRSATQVIVDLRFNGGGYHNEIAPLLAALKKYPALAANGRTRVLIGNGTFSAAVIYAAALKKELAAVLVGEPTGGGQTVYADAQSLSLSDKGLAVMFPRKKISAGYGTRGPLVPDYFVSRSSYSDLCHGYDPQLQAAVSLQR